MSIPHAGTLRFLNLKALQTAVKNREDEYSRRSNFLEYFSELITVNKLRHACTSYLSLNLFYWIDDGYKNF